MLNDEHAKNYEVYNLAYAGNSPFRENFDDELIEIDPLLIIYGISYRDFEFSDKNNFESSIFPNIKNIVEYQLLKIGNNNIPLNPQFIIRSLIRDFDSNEIEQKQNTQYLNNTPFFLYSKNPKLKTHDEVTANLFNFTRDPLADISSPFNKHSEKFLELFIEKMQKNSINIVLISTPISDIENIDIEKRKKFDDLIFKLKTKYNVKFYNFDSKYNGLDIWADASHISYHPSVSQFNFDIFEIIKNEVN